MAKYITKNVVLEKEDVEDVIAYAKSKGLDNKRGFSAAVRGIIREHKEKEKREEELKKQGS